MYTEDERRVFQYSGGPSKGPRAADPLEVLRKFVIHFQGRSLREVVYEEWAVEAPEAREGMSEEEAKLFRHDRAWIELQSAKAEQLLIDASREIFEIEPFDKQEGTGATDGEVLATLTEFLKFLA